MYGQGTSYGVWFDQPHCGIKPTVFAEIVGKSTTTEQQALHLTKNGTVKGYVITTSEI